MGQPTQTVIYRLDKAHKPIWQFHSMPESIVGGGRSLEDARAQYRGALSFSLDGGPLPDIHEFIERDTKRRIWVRTALESPVADNAYRMVARQLSTYPDEDLEWLSRYPSAGGDPVVVSCGPTDSLGSIFDQITPFDFLIAVMGHGSGDRVTSLVWLVIQGAATVKKGDRPSSLDEFRLTRDSPMSEVFRLATQHGDVTVSRRFDQTPTAPALLAPA
jgi:hypothetical protein